MITNKIVLLFASNIEYETIKNKLINNNFYVNLGKSNYSFGKVINYKFNNNIIEYDIMFREDFIDTYTDKIDSILSDNVVFDIYEI